MQSKLVEALAKGELSWQDYANCRGADADLFFPERGLRRVRPRPSAVPVR
jgi:hypothetical protein